MQSQGWTLLAHPAFRQQLDRLEAQVRRLAASDPDGYRRRPQAKLLAAIVHLILDVVPRDPAAAQFRLGNTLGPAYRHWRRVKFLGRFRLFFRFHAQSRTIVYAWVNDESTLRKAGAATDPYATFARMLKAGNPPDDFAQLAVEAAKVPPRDAG